MVKAKAHILEKYVKATPKMWWNKDIVTEEWLGIRMGNPNRNPKDKAS